MLPELYFLGGTPVCPLTLLEFVCVVVSAVPVVLVVPSKISALLVALKRF